VETTGINDQTSPDSPCSLNFLSSVYAFKFSVLAHYLFPLKIVISILSSFSLISSVLSR
jgi:hypothetical protein